MTADLKRLGKRSAYRLGQLRVQGSAGNQRPVPFQPRFIRPYHRWPTSTWLLALLAGVLLVVAGAVLGWWFMPFACGVLAGLANRIGRWRTRVALPAVAIVAALGWAVPIVWSVLNGQPYAAVARVIAALLGLPANPAVGIAVALIVAVVQAVAGYWLGRALTPMPADD
ncbi:MAG TPA: hypothetical protein VME44_25525 [Streptosporangiaceae bacterium]|nr:hypothetical protein [Streptosporangiaceae bacterium]